MSHNVDNKRIAKNAILLYIRMLLSIIVSLYTSRVVLNTLGVEDYGIYNVVGGVVTMFTFLNTSMAGATSRFLTYEIGCNNINKLVQTFKSAFVIHICISIIILIIAETIGLWILANKLNIPENRLFAAHIVYQCTILATIINVLQVPYNAAIIAHEKMDFYAYVELAHVFLKLGIVYILLVFSFDKLILYSVLILIVTTLITAIYITYSTRQFHECKLVKGINKEIIIPMMTFSCWDLYGNMSVSIRQQGTTILLNMFYGPILNAASGIAMSVHNILLGFANNIVMAFRPQIIKKYAEGNIKQMVSLITNSSKYTLCLFLLISIPLFFEAEYVLHLWLKNVPEHTVVFLKVVLICSIFKLLNSILNIAIHATGKVKLLSIISGSIFLMTIPIMYILMKVGLSANTVYCIMIPLDFMILFSGICILKYLIKEIKIYQLIFKAYLPCFGLLVILPIFFHIVQISMEQGFIRLIIQGTISIFITTIYTFIIILNNDQRQNLRQLIKRKINKII